jgi:UDP:flavonoid glycosyltransferase YjiC (YdhE family)
MPEQKPGNARILFIAEAVTLAHVARPVTLAQALDPQAFDVHLAHHPRYRELLGALELTEHEIHSIPPGQFTQALAAGRPLYDYETLKAYVEEDLQLLSKVQPDVVVGDFRLSLAVSAEIAGTPYIALSNAYWSPYCRQRYIVPELPMTRVLGPTLAQAVFSLARPLAFALHCLPMNRLRRSYGLRGLGFDLREIYTHADYTLYADIPELYRMQNMPHRHRFIGPVVWSPSFPRPNWWDDLHQGSSQQRPIVYVTLGSSGQASLLPTLVDALGRLDVTALVSTAGAPLPQNLPANVYPATYLPGADAVAMSDLVICNGGSPGTHQALVQGVPVIGVAGNLDQYLNMSAIQQTGAGLCLRAGTCHAGQLAKAVTRMLADPVCRTAAQKLAARLRRDDPVAELRKTIDELLSQQYRQRMSDTPATICGVAP